MRETPAKKLASDPSMGRYNPELDKFEDIDLFPEKTAKAREMLRKYPVPQHLLKTNKS